MGVATMLLSKIRLQAMRLAIAESFATVAFIAMMAVSCIQARGQAANPNHTADWPSVERVKAEIKGSGPTDTLARQVAVFTYLGEYVKRIKYNRTVSGPYTPEEQSLLGAY